jgi:hypothetical protein
MCDVAPVGREAGYRDRLLALLPHLNEREHRIAAALEARSLGYGGVSAVAVRRGQSVPWFIWDLIRGLASEKPAPCRANCDCSTQGPFTMW